LRCAGLTKLHVVLTIIKRKTSLKGGIVMKLIMKCLVAALLVLPKLGEAQFPSNPYNGLLYWDSYWYQQHLDAPMNEAVWKTNADWVARNLAGSGYRMVATDGWIEKSTVLNQNGYVTKHNLKLIRY